MRGKDNLADRCRSRELGSPPLARERLAAPACHPVLSRITPACAGKTSCSGCCCQVPEDHPRLRGKDVFLKNDIGFWSGSPPLARERLARDFLIREYAGITPACAGKTPTIAVYDVCFQDHPRLRGKDALKGHIEALRRGSPPLARERRI